LPLPMSPMVVMPSEREEHSAAIHASASRHDPKLTVRGMTGWASPRVSSKATAAIRILTPRDSSVVKVGARHEDGRNGEAPSYYCHGSMGERSPNGDDSGRKRHHVDHEKPERGVHANPLPRWERHSPRQFRTGRTGGRPRHGGISALALCPLDTAACAVEMATSHFGRVLASSNPASRSTGAPSRRTRTPLRPTDPVRPLVAPVKPVHPQPRREEQE
jgi:hypothetical protein